MREGCGRVEYSHGSFSGGARYQFERETKALVAGATWTDVSFGPCTQASAYHYEAGSFLDLTACDDFTECLNCTTLLPEPATTPSCGG